MGKSSYNKQRNARRTLDDLFINAGNTLIVHYSCGGFYNRISGTSPRITSIAVRRLESGQTVSFSIHQTAERNKFDLSKIDAEYDRLERQMLDEFFQFLERHQSHRWLHWNMRDINYGFA